MPTYVTGNLWDFWEVGCHVCFTANATRNHKGHMVMGAGAAKEAKELFPGVEVEFGKQLAALNGFKYGVMWVNTTMIDSIEWGFLGAFQTKYHWRGESSLELIEFSCIELVKYIKENNISKVVMNFPGIGLGGLDRADVELILNKYLPANVIVVTYPTHKIFQIQSIIKEVLQTVNNAKVNRIKSRLS